MYQFSSRKLEDGVDLRTAAVLLVETVSHQLGEKELRALAPVAWRLLLSRTHDAVQAASMLFMLCGEHTAQSVKNVICSDLYGYVGYPLCLCLTSTAPRRIHEREACTAMKASGTSAHVSAPSIVLCSRRRIYTRRLHRVTSARRSLRSHRPPCLIRPLWANPSATKCVQRFL